MPQLRYWFWLAACLAPGAASAQDLAATAAVPQRINKAIELLARGQPVYYTTATGGYEQGLQLADTESDYINYDMEHGAFDIAALRAFMRGLVDAGPTASGHRTPAVIVTLPVYGLEQGLRGSGSQSYAAGIWGLSGNEYLEKADPWPLNPDGELLLGVKIEDSYALENAEETTAVPGIAFTEWGPGDMGFWIVGLPLPGAQQLPAMRAARGRVFDASRANGIFMLHTCNEDNVVEMLDEGVMICTGGYRAGRAHTNREMPW